VQRAVEEIENQTIDRNSQPELEEALLPAELSTTKEPDDARKGNDAAEEHGSQPVAERSRVWTIRAQGHH
jgi:hypothetical protein